MRKSLKIAAILVAAMITSSPVAMAAPKGWEQVKGERVEARTVVKEDDTEVKVVRGAVIITTDHAVSVKIVTILGRTISSETLQPGTWQLSLPTHGVYIVKVGDITCKVGL